MLQGKIWITGPWARPLLAQLLILAEPAAIDHLSYYNLSRNNRTFALP